MIRNNVGYIEGWTLSSCINQKHSFMILFIIEKNMLVCSVVSERTEIKEDIFLFSTWKTNHFIVADIRYHVEGVEASVSSFVYVSCK